MWTGLQVAEVQTLRNAPGPRQSSNRQGSWRATFTYNNGRWCEGELEATADATPAGRRPRLV
eukprot:7231795-Alexandrium_andersonii.AAC.1